jgi:cell division protein FtsL
MGRVVRVNIDHTARDKELIAQNKQRTMFFRIVFAMTVIIAIAAAVAFGPVWLMADATRMSQASAILKAEIADEFTVNQKLSIDEAAIKSNDRLARVAKEDLGMVEPTTPKTWIDIDASDEEELSLPAEKEASFWRQVAQLTVGEASALLVGDVGLSALR